MKLNYPASLIQLFLNELHVPVSASTIKKEVYKHPDNNSVLGLSELMNNWNVPNGAFRITFDELLVNEISYPFITSLADNQFIVVKGIQNGNFIVGDDAKKNYLISSDKFKSKFNEWIFIAEKDEKSGETNYWKSRTEEILSSSRLPLVVCGALLSILLLLINERVNLNAIGWRVPLLIAIKSVGVCLTLLLLSQSAGSENLLLKRICKIGKGDCNSILASDAAKITSWLSWSEVGFFLFYEYLADRDI